MPIAGVMLNTAGSDRVRRWRHGEGMNMYRNISKTYKIIDNLMTLNFVKNVIMFTIKRDVFKAVQMAVTLKYISICALIIHNVPPVFGC